MKTTTNGLSVIFWFEKYNTTIDECPWSLPMPQRS